MTRPITVVAGGAGFLGSHLCDALVEQGVQVVCVDNMLTGNMANIEHLIGRANFSCELGDAKDWKPGRSTVEAVYHLASPASPTAYMRYPMETLAAGSSVTLNLVDVARRDDSRIIFTSTSEVYGDPLEHPQTERYWGNVNPIGVRSVYDEAKRFSEAMLFASHRSSETNVGVLRLFNSYGRRMDPLDGRAVPAFFRQALAGEDVTVAGSGRQTRSLCYMSDTVRALIAMGRSTASGPINIGGTEEITILGLAREIIRVTRSDSRITFIAANSDDPKRRKPDIAVAERILNWRPTVSLNDGLRRTAEDYRNGNTSGVL